MPTMDTLPITAREVADILGIGRRQVLRLIESGEIPTLGKLEGGTGAYLFNRSDIQALTPKTAPTSATSPQKADVGVSPVGDAS